MIEFIFLKIPGVKYFLSEKLCQDPLESFFGNQRMHGSSINDNPNVATFCPGDSFHLCTRFCISSAFGRNITAMHNPELVVDEIYV